MALPNDANMTDLMERLLRNDEAAWRRLVRDYSGLLIALAARTFAAYNYQASHHDCEDAVAEVWKNILEHDKRLIRQALDKGFFLQTICVLTRNRAIDRMRARKIRTEPYAEDLIAEAPAQEETPEVSPEQIESALKTLNPRERAVINLFFLQNKSYREITLLAGMPGNSIGPTLSRALAKLRHELKGHLDS